MPSRLDLLRANPKVPSEEANCRPGHNRQPRLMGFEVEEILVRVQKSPGWRPARKNPRARKPSLRLMVTERANLGLEKLNVVTRDRIERVLETLGLETCTDFPAASPAAEMPTRAAVAHVHGGPATKDDAWEQQGPRKILGSRSFEASNFTTRAGRAPKNFFRLDKAVVKAILDHVRRFPTDGCMRVAYELDKLGIVVSSGGVHGLWKRKNLTTADRRLAYAKAGLKKTAASLLVLNANEISGRMDQSVG